MSYALAKRGIKVYTRRIPKGVRSFVFTAIIALYVAEWNLWPGPILMTLTYILMFILVWSIIWAIMES